MSNCFNFPFWKKDYLKRFNLDKEGEEILDYFIAMDKIKAEEFIKDKYQRDVYKTDIIDTYCEKFNIEKINKILKEIGFDPLTRKEIKEYELKSNEFDI